MLNGSHDRFHNSDLFPRVAQALKNGVLVQMVVGESRRERLMGVTASLFASLSSDEGTPAALRPFATIP